MQIGEHRQRSPSALNFGDALLSVVSSSPFCASCMPPVMAAGLPMALCATNQQCFEDLFTRRAEWGSFIFVVTLVDAKSACPWLLGAALDCACCTSLLSCFCCSSRSIHSIRSASPWVSSRSAVLLSPHWLSMMHIRPMDCARVSD